MAEPRVDSDRSKRKAGRISNVVCPNCKQSLDDVIESLIRQRGKFKGQREQARGERDKARAEVERLREALGAVRMVAGRFIQRGHSGFEYEEISEALAVALQELSTIRRRASRALDEKDDS